MKRLNIFFNFFNTNYDFEQGEVLGGGGGGERKETLFAPRISQTYVGGDAQGGEGRLQ